MDPSGCEVTTLSRKVGVFGAGATQNKLRNDRAQYCANYQRGIPGAEEIDQQTDERSNARPDDPQHDSPAHRYFFAGSPVMYTFSPGLSSFRRWRISSSCSPGSLSSRRIWS